jgi:hypothetical protein
MARQVLDDPVTRQRGYFRGEFLQRLFNMGPGEHSSNVGEFVWSLVLLELWHRQHLAPRRDQPQGRVISLDRDGVGR